MERQTTQTFVTNNNNALIEARMNLSEAAEPVGEIVTRPVRVERDSKAEISSVEMGIGPHFSMSVAQRGTHAVVGAKNGGIAVVTLSSLYSGSPQIVTAKLPSSSTSSGVVVACSATAETIAAYTTKASKVYVYSRTLSLKTEITRAKPIRAIAVSSDGSKVAIGCENKQVSVYSISLVGQSLSMEYDVKELVENYPCSLAFSQSGKVLAMGGDFRKGCVWSTSSRSAEPLRVFARGGVIGAIAFSKSDKWMAMGSSGDQLLTLIDTATWEIHDEVPQSGSVTAVSFSADELALGCVSNKVLKVINRATLETTHEIGGSSDFARDEDDRTTQHADRTALHAGWTPDGTLIVMGMKKVFSFDYKTQRACVVPPRLTPGFNSKQSIALSAYGQHVAYSCSSNLPGQSKAVQMLVVETVGYARAKLPAFTFKLGEDGSLLKVAFSPDNSKLAALTASRLVVFDNDRNNGWKKRADLALKSAATFAWSASAKSIAVWLASTVVSLSADNLASQEVREHNSVFAYDLGRLGRDFAGQGLGDEAKLRTLAGPIVVAIGGRKMQAAPKLSPDGRTVAAGGNGKLALIDTTTMEATEAHEVKGWVYGLAWAPDSQTLAIGSYDKTVTVLNVVANVVVARCGERGYFPEALAFSQNCGMLVDGGGSSTKAQFAVYSCDSSRLPLIEPTDSAPMLRAQQPGTKRSDFDVKRRGAVMDLIDVYPAIALNPLPSGDLSLQPAAGGASRMADVLAHRTERDLLEELVERIPALAVLPSGGRKHPTFTIALKQRDVRTLRVLLVAGARAPIAARSILATKLIPAIVQMRMGSAVTAFLQQVALEESGASITSGCHRDGTPLVQDDVLELHPTHGGAGTSIWLGHHEDPSKLKALLDARKGIEQGKEEAIESMGFVSGLFARARRALFAALTSASAYTPLGEKPAASYTRAYNALASAIERVPNDDLRLFLKLQVLVLVPQPDGEIAATRSRVGTEVQAMRVPIPGLSSRACLEGLCRIGLNGTFDNALMRPTVHCLWRNHFFIAHLVKSLLHAVHVAALAVYIIEIASGNRFYDNEWSARLLYAVAGICVMSAYVVFFELRQLLGFQLHHGLVSGTIMYVCSFWNIGDLLTALVPLYAIALDAAGGAIDEGHVHVKGLLACSAILMFMRSAQLLQGFELTGWLVMVLMQNVIDMVGFIVLVSTSIFFFSLAFLMLFVDADGGERGYRQAWHSLMSTFTMGVFADFDVHVLDGGNTINTPMSVTLFVLFMVIVGVVSLNALIAFLGDSYAKVQDRQVEATLSLKARLIVEYYTAAGPFAQLTEKRVAWMHVLRVVKDDGVKSSGNWAGQLAEVKRDIEWFNNKLSKDVLKQSLQLEDLKATLGQIATAVGSSRSGAAGEGAKGKDRPLETGDSVVGEQEAQA